AVAEAGRRTTSRRDLARHERFTEVSPEVGVIDPDALSEFLEDDPDAALALLADMVSATDDQLRAMARAQAGRVMVDAARTGPQRQRGVGKLRRAPLESHQGDVDLDASLDELVRSRRSNSAPNPAEVTVTTWARPEVALCLLVDRSGSMAGDRLAAAAVAAAAVMFRAPNDVSVVAFAEDAVVVCAQDERRSPEDVVSDLLRLRGFGVTDVGLALRVAATQLGRSGAGRRIAVLLSDCRATTGGEPLRHLTGVDELVVLAPEGDTADAEALADAIGARWTAVGGPSSVAEALQRVLGPPT
ncbi:MAG: VWA domain-containing protein, partial [Actinomycetes bacterium]